MGRQCLLCFVNDVVNIQNLSNSKIFTLSLHYSKSSGESFELCDKGLLGNFLKDIQQRSFPSRGKKTKGNSMKRHLYFKKKTMLNNIEKRETLRLNLNNNEFTSISIQM